MYVQINSFLTSYLLNDLLIGVKGDNLFKKKVCH